MGYVEVDQSGKVEQFDKDTVVAMSNDSRFSVLLPKKEKQGIFTKYKIEVPDLKYKIFSILLFHCLKYFIDNDTKVVICREYTGKERLIKSELYLLFDGRGYFFNPRLTHFDMIGKHSGAHELAISVFRKNLEPDLILSEKDIAEFLK